MSFATNERSRLFWERAETDLVEQLAAASERVFDAKLTPEAVRQRLLPSVRQSRGGDWMLKAKLPAHARFWNAGGTFADRPAELAHCAARVRLRARSLWLMSGMCGLSLEVTDLRVEPVKKIRIATHILERREQLRPVLKAAVDAEALKRGASHEEVGRLHDELARGAPVLERLIADGLAGRFLAEEVDILDWKEMLKRAQDLQLKLCKRLNQRAARMPAMAEERQEESWAPMEALREKREALRQRRIRTRDVATLAQIELFEVVSKKIAERLPVLLAAKSATLATLERLEASRELLTALNLQGSAADLL